MDGIKGSGKEPIGLPLVTSRTPDIPRMLSMPGRSPSRNSVFI